MHRNILELAKERAVMYSSIGSRPRIAGKMNKRDEVR